MEFFLSLFFHTHHLFHSSSHAPPGFKAGMKLYFSRHDGSAVTCDDFRSAMADANSADLSQFERWYSQAGTPVLTVGYAYDADKRSFTISLQQHTPGTPGQAAEAKLPLVIPVVVGLLSAETGREIVPSRWGRLVCACVLVCLLCLCVCSVCFFPCLSLYYCSLSQLDSFPSI